MVAGPSTGSEMAGELNFSAPLGHFITASATASADAPSRTIHGRPIHVEHLGQGAKADQPCEYTGSSPNGP